MRIVLTGIAYLLALGLVGAGAFAVVIVVAGPHAGILPSFLEPVVLGLGWLAVLIVPIRIARSVWMRLAKRFVEMGQR